MPFYEYECRNCGHELEAMQKITDPPLKKCPDCGKPQLKRLMSAPVFRLKGYYRFHFQLQSPSAAALHQLLRRVVPAVRPPAGVEFTLDVDPFNML